MKLEIPGQLRGSDAGKVMPIAIKLRRELEPSFADLGDDRLSLITPILRIGGELGTFGEDAIENIKVTDKEAECDVVVEPRNWKEMDEDQISDLIRTRVIGALHSLLTAAGFETIPEFLRKEQYKGEQGAAPNP